MKRLSQVLFTTALLVLAPRAATASEAPAPNATGEIVAVDQPMSAVLAKLRDLGHRVCFEQVRIDTTRDRIVDAEGRVSWREKKISVRLDRESELAEMLDTLVDLDDSYAWYRYGDSDLYVVYPVADRNPQSNESALMWGVGPVEVEDKPLRAVLEDDLELETHDVSLTLRGTREPLARPVTATLGRMAFREALDELLAGESDLYWALGGLSHRILYIGRID